MDNEFNLVETNHFSEIESLWTNLWPGRTDIRAMSSLTINLETDMSIYDKYNPIFWIIQRRGIAIGCLSGHGTSHELFRVRGLYINDEYRRQGLASMLLKHSFEYAKKENYKIVWSLPRVDIFRVYEAAGFFQCSHNITEGMVSGPNILAVHLLF